MVAQMDEEDLYSAVGRQPYSHATSSGRPTEDADAANDATFGEPGSSSAQMNNSAGPARTAWTGAGTSVAVVAGSSRSLPHQHHALLALSMKEACVETSVYVEQRKHSPTLSPEHADVASYIWQQDSCLS